MHGLKFTFQIILFVELIMGSVGNGFIVLVNCTDWVRRRKISSADQILTALAVSRLAMLSLPLLCTLVTRLCPGLLTSTVIRVTDVVWVVTNHFNLWLATSLSVFYLLKVATFSNSVFLYLKWRVQKVTSATLLASLLVLLLNILVTHRYHDVREAGSKGAVPTGSGARNATRVSKVLFLASCLFTLVPSAVSLLAFLLLIVSLRRHQRQMRSGVGGPRDASTAAHARALCTGVLLLLLYAVFSASLAAEMSSFELLGDRLIMLLEHATGMAFPSGHSWVLVLGNSKLRRAFLSALRQLRWRPKGGGPSAR